MTNSNIFKFKFRKLHLLVVALFLFGFPTSQTVAQPPLETLLHLDKSFYATGEIVWFKLYLPFTWKDADVAINTSILDSEGQTIDQFFIKTEGRTYVNGYYQVPYDQRSGYLEIQFTASSDAQKAENVIGHYSFPVYNDLEVPKDIKLVDQPAQISEPQLYAEELNININLLENQVACRDIVHVQLNVIDNEGKPVSGHASISVKEIEVYKPVGAEVRTLPLSYTIDQSDLKSEIYTRGQLTNPDGSPLQMNVLGGYVGRDQKVYYSKSFENGNFEITLPDFTGRKIIQLVGFQYEKPDLRSTMTFPQALSADYGIIYTEEIIKYLELSRLRKKIYQYFNAAETDLQTAEIDVPAQELKPDARYSVKEYESFKDMKSFFGELLTPLRFKLEKDSTYAATLFNAKGGRRSNTILNGPPLFIIDGKMTRNADFVARLPISAVETVELFLDAPKVRSYFQAIGVSGVVKISTSIANLKLPDADAGNIHPIFGLQPKADFPAIKKQPDQLGDHQPYFRPQLFWKPDLNIEVGAATEFSFLQSDDAGAFEIKVVFQSEDGRRVTATHQYEVAYP